MSKDTIYREDAIKAINARSNWYQVTCNGKQIAVMLMAKDVNEMLEKVPSADRPQEWIPCSERMPKIGEVVLVTWEWKCKKYITTAYRVTIRGVTYWDSKLQHEYKPLNVLAWMPLPKPWKGADDEDCH